MHRIAVDKPHELYMEECGNPQGIPVVFLHGGPGSGCSPLHRRYFNPQTYRIILCDQRGSGRSRPLGETAGNNTASLVSDLEVIRRHLDIDQWLLFGGSWGATLALVYALTHPHRVSGMILRGSFLARDMDLDWFFVTLKRLFPMDWMRFSKDLSAGKELEDIIAWYHTAVHGKDRDLSMRAASNWSEWGTGVVHWHHNPSQQDPVDQRPESEEKRARLLAKVKIETHYARHRYFIGDDEILNRIDTLPAMPVSIVHGRFDLTCSMESSWLLHRSMPNSRFIQVADAGHLIDEPVMIAALVEETDRMGELL
jgi:proline iminopeptidase